MNSYQQALADRKDQHLLRSLPLPPEGIDFFSNDYLGLAQNPRLQQVTQHVLADIQQQNGATGSRLLSGNSAFAEEVEKQIAGFHQEENALIYGSGYTANVGLISCLATKDTTLICDELIHASLIDGARLGQSKKVRFKHNDVADLSNKLADTKGQKLVIVESVYSMDGDTCPLEKVAKLCQENEAMLIVDEAHAIGVFGEKGEGLVQSLDLEKVVTARVMTYGKGPGIHGAAIVGPQWLKDYQVNFSRSAIFSTAPPDHQLAAISAMYQLLPDIKKERDALQEVTDYFISKRTKGNWLDSPSQIQSLIIPGNEEVVSAGQKLKDAGINALPIRKPSVAAGAERIRFCLHSYNTKAEIDLLFNSL